MKALKEAEELAKNNDHITLDIYNNGFFTRDKSLQKLRELEGRKLSRDEARITNGFKKVKNKNEALDKIANDSNNRYTSLKNFWTSLEQYRQKSGKYFRNYDKEILTPSISQHFDTIDKMNKNEYGKAMKKNGAKITAEERNNFSPETLEMFDQGPENVFLRTGTNCNYCQKISRKDDKKPIVNLINLTNPIREASGTYFHEFGHAIDNANLKDRTPRPRLLEEFSASSLLPSKLKQIGGENDLINKAERYRTLQVGDGYITSGAGNFERIYKGEFGGKVKVQQVGTGRRGAKKAGIDSEMMKDLRKMKKEQKNKR